MNVLLVDNKSAHLERLKSLITEKLGKVNLKQYDPRDITSEYIKWADLVVISGGWGRSIIKNPRTFSRIVELCTKHKKPTIGICLGAEAIAYHYGSQLRELPVRRVGNVRSNFAPPFSQPLPQDSATMYEFHKWVIDDVSAPLVSLATSKDGVELFKHQSLPMWGMQFHPEVRRLENKGHLVFEYVLRDIGVVPSLSVVTK